MGRQDGSLAEIKRTHETFDPLRDPQMRPTSFQAYLRIQIGCDKFCTYCVVPMTRGPEQGRPARQIVEEPTIRQDQRTRADRRDQCLRFCQVSQPISDRGVSDLLSRAEATRIHENVERRGGGPGVVGEHPQSLRAPNDSVTCGEDATGAALKAIQCVELASQGLTVHPRWEDRSYPDFALQRCTQCKRCTEECPFGTLNEDEKGTPQLNITRCRRCGICRRC